MALLRSTDRAHRWGPPVVPDAGVAAISGSGAAVFSAVAGAASGSVTIVGASVSVGASLTGAAAGAEMIAGSGSGSFQALAGAASGAPAGSGTGAGTLPVVTGAATGFTADLGAGAGTFSPLAGSATGVALVEGSGAALLPRFIGAGIGGGVALGHGTLPAVSGAGSGTEAVTGAGAGSFSILLGHGLGGRTPSPPSGGRHIGPYGFPHVWREAGIVAVHGVQAIGRVGDVRVAAGPAVGMRAIADGLIRLVSGDRRLGALQKRVQALGGTPPTVPGPGARLRALDQRIRALSARPRPPGVRYRGVHDVRAAYAAGDCVTFAGGLWVSRGACRGGRPGDGGEAWQLAVKSNGRDGGR